MIFRMVVAIITLLLWVGFLDSAAYPVSAANEKKSKLESKESKRRKSATVFGILDMNGMTRRYHVYVPDSCKGKKNIPLVLVFHGAMENGEIIRKITGMDAEAEKRGFIAVYPYGSGRLKGKYLCWNAFDCCGIAIHKNIDDVGFVSTLIDKLTSEYSIDSNRVYACGYSNGAMFCYRLASELPSKLAAVAIIGGSMSGKENVPDKPVSVLIIHGTDDRHVPYNGGTGKWAKWGYPVNGEPVSYALKFWNAANKCGDNPKTSDGKELKIESFHDADGGNEVKLITLKGARHTWPSGLRSLLYTDKPFNGLNATEECWKFFEAHPRNAGVVVSNSNVEGPHAENKNK